MLQTSFKSKIVCIDILLKCFIYLIKLSTLIAMFQNYAIKPYNSVQFTLFTGFLVEFILPEHII